MSKLIWNPSENRISSSAMDQFRRDMAAKYQVELNDYHDLHRWSVNHVGDFWKELISYFNIELNGDDSLAYEKLEFLNYPWFPKAKISFAKNLLKHKESEKIALNSQHEAGTLEKITYRELYRRVGHLQNFLKDYVNDGDIVAAYMPNISHTPITMLATNALGGTFTSTSADFGIQGVVDRFGQTCPKVLVTVKGYSYGGKYFDQTDKINQIIEQIPSIEAVILVDFLDQGGSIKFKNTFEWNDLIKETDVEVSYKEMPFSHPLYVMYSSGTTGKPKCIVHSAGGTLLQHVKELGLHTDLNENKSIFYFTTCGWMMWNWLISSLYFGAEVVLFEGSPGHPSLDDFIKIIDREKINIFGTSPKFLRALEINKTDLSSSFESLETMLSTGAPLLPEQYDFVYDNFKSDLLLASISGGTDIIGCFMLGNPVLPVHRGEIQCPGLAMDVQSFDHEGKAIFGTEGELVCCTPFPSQPIGFWNDSDKEKFKKSYFNVYENTWHHGDFITFTEQKTIQVHGRSDATLNPGGVRIGTAEIYRQTEKLPYLDDSICVGQNYDGDVRVILFVQLKKGEGIDDERIKEIKKTIKDSTTPRHVPAVIKAVSGIPYTMSGKKMEMAIARIINGKQLTNIEAVSNPQCLKQYEGILKDC